jgi:hypothetical protein
MADNSFIALSLLFIVLFSAKSLIRHFCCAEADSKFLCWCSNIGLALNLNSNTGYNTPKNVPYLGNPYLYYGFLPITTAGTTGTTQGLQVKNSV